MILLRLAIGIGFEVFDPFLDDCDLSQVLKPFSVGEPPFDLQYAANCGQSGYFSASFKSETKFDDDDCPWALLRLVSVELSKVINSSFFLSFLLSLLVSGRLLAACRSFCWPFCVIFQR
jgi:hypothetical protein